MAWTAPRTWVTGELVTATLLNTHLKDNLNAAFPVGVDAWTAYTPTLTASTSNPTLGASSSAVGKYTRIGRTVIGWARIKFGSSGTAAGTGNYRVSIPVVPAAASGDVNTIGHGLIQDTSAGALFLLGGLYHASSNQFVELPVESGSVVTEASPFAWSTGDVIWINFTYEAAS